MAEACNAGGGKANPFGTCAESLRLIAAAVSAVHIQYLHLPISDIIPEFDGKSSEQVDRNFTPDCITLRVIRMSRWGGSDFPKAAEQIYADRQHAGCEEIRAPLCQPAIALQLLSIGCRNSFTEFTPEFCPGKKMSRRNRYKPECS